MLDPCDPVHANRSEAEGTRRKETRDVCVRQVGPASSQTPVCPFPLFFFLFFLSSLFITLFFHDHVVVAFLPAVCAHAPSSKRDVWVYISRARVYRTPTMYVCTREWRYSYAIRFRAKRKRSCSKRRGVFTISLETRRNLEKGTVPNHWETSYPLVASLSFRISSAFSKSGEEEVVKDLVSCSINIYNRASYPISSVLYKYSRGRIDSRCSSLCEKLVLPFALVPFFSFFFCFVFFCFWERYMPIGASISKNYWPRIIERTFPVIVLPGRWDKIDCQRRFLSPAISMNGWWLATEIARGKSG